MSDTANSTPSEDERVKEMSSFRKALIRPELGGIAGTILVFIFFFLTARDSGMFSPAGVMNWSIVSAQFTIIAVGACLLMIAGEFDLSVGSMIGFSGIVIALVSVSWGYPMWVAILTAFAVSVAIGALNGFLVIRTGLPSFKSIVDRKGMSLQKSRFSFENRLLLKTMSVAYCDVSSGAITRGEGSSSTGSGASNRRVSIDVDKVMY